MELLGKILNGNKVKIEFWMLQIKMLSIFIGNNFYQMK